jgi:hypothetical protein
MIANRTIMPPRELGSKNFVRLLEMPFDKGSDPERLTVESQGSNIDLNEAISPSIEHDADAEKDERNDDDDRLENDEAISQEPPAPMWIGPAKRQRDEMEEFEEDEQMKKRHRARLYGKSTEIQKRLDRIERILLKQISSKQQEDSEEESEDSEDDDDDEGDDDTDDQNDDNEEEDDLEDDSIHEDDERGVVPSHPHSKPSKLTVDGKAAREILKEHFGPLDDFLPLTHSISKKKKDSIINQTESLEAFYPKIRRIERPFTDQKWNEREKDRKLYKLITTMREMYDCEMGVLFDIATGNQKKACQHALQLIDLTLDCATNANLDRVSLRSGSSVVDMIKHADEEEVLQAPYKQVIAKKAKEESELQTLTRGRSFQRPAPSLRKWGRMRRGWDSPPSRSGSRGRGGPSQSKSKSTGVYPRYPARHQSSERRAPSAGQQDKKTVHSVHSPKSFPVGSRKF